MQRGFIVCFFLMLSCSGAFAQLSAERQAVARMQKGKWKGAEEALRKSLRKDSINPEAKYTFSRYFFSSANPAFQIDSAYRYANLAMKAWSQLQPREKEKLLRYPIDSSILVAQRASIDSAAFEAAKKSNSEEAYQAFLTKYLSARQRTQAIELRNEVAFVDALKLNTSEGFWQYLHKYPESGRAAEARDRYDKLLYEVATRDGHLESYLSFFRQHPESPFHQLADRQVFEIFTASGAPEAFTSFLERHPKSSFRQRAQVILYHLAKEEDLFVKMTLTDSLKKVQHEEEGYWVPVLRNGKFGFIDRTGKEVIAPKFEKIKPEYICGNVREDHLVVDGGIISRTGHWIFQGATLEVIDLGSGFLKVNTGNCVRVLHKSGFAVPGDCLEDAKMLGHHFIAVRRRGLWGLVTLTGREILEPQCETISSVDDLIILGMNGKMVMVTVPQIAALTERNPLPRTLVFDDVQRIAYGNYRVRNGALEGVLNEDLHYVVPLDRQGITRVPDGFMLDKSGRYRLTGYNDLPEEFLQVQFYGDWIRLASEGNLQLYDWRKRRMIRSGIDSLWFERKLALVRQGDSLHVYLRSGASVNFSSDTPVHFIRSADSTEYFFAPEKGVKNEKGKISRNGKAVFNTLKGTKLFVFDFDDCEYLGGSMFLITRGGKKGLVNETGKVLLPVEYDAMVPIGSGILSLLREKKFGAYQLSAKKLLKPVYDRNTTPVGKGWLSAYRDGGYGLIGWDGKALGEFEFEEVRPWNDTSVLVKRDFQWMIYGIRSAKILRSKIMDYTFILDTPEEKLAIVHQDLRYGVISNRRGEIIPANFSDVVNVGSAEAPLYFAEKNVEEAGIYVVIYYDGEGKLIRKQVYEEAEYERIYCSDN